MCSIVGAVTNAAAPAWRVRSGDTHPTLTRASVEVFSAQHERLDGAAGRDPFARSR
jgi:hypothetical protein